MMKNSIVIMLAALLLSGCANSNFDFTDSSELSIQENPYEIINSKTNIKYPLREDLLSPNYTGGYKLNFINQSNYNHQYAAYDLIKAREEKEIKKLLKNKIIEKTRKKLLNILGNSN